MAKCARCGADYHPDACGCGVAVLCGSAFAEHLMGCRLPHEARQSTHDYAPWEAPAGECPICWHSAREAIAEHERAEPHQTILDHAGYPDVRAVHLTPEQSVTRAKPMSSERAKKRAAELHDRGVGKQPVDWLASELDRYACEAIIESGWRAAVEATVSEQLREVALIIQVERCSPNGGCPFCAEGGATDVCALGGYVLRSGQPKPEWCPLPSSGVLVRAKP